MNDKPITTNFVIVKHTNSVGIAILLTFVLGPVGLFYSSVTGGIVMTFTPGVLFMLMIGGLAGNSINLFIGSLGLLFVFTVVCWLICIIWAVYAVNDYNRRIRRAYARQQQSLHQAEVIHSSLIQNSNYQDIPESRSHPVESAGKSSLAPSFQEWLKQNPRGTLNQYYTSLSSIR